MFNTPKAPDPSQALAQGQMVANQQQALNNQTAAGAQASSMVNQENPYGSLTYRQTGTSPYGTPIYTANMQLNPEQQALFDQLTQTKGAAGNQAYNLLSGANYGSSQPSDAIGSLTSGLTGQLVDKYKTYIDPFQQTERDRLDTQLRNQGLAPGMPGYDNALRQLDTSHSLANSKAVADYENQAFGQASQLYSLPAMLGLQLAGFGQPGDVKNDLVQAPAYNANPANLIGATANAQDWQQQQYQNQLNSQSNAMQGLFGIGSAALGGWAKAGFPGANIFSK